MAPSTARASARQYYATQLGMLALAGAAVKAAVNLYPARAAYLPPSALAFLEAATARWSLSITLAAGPVLAALVAAAYGLWAAAAAQRRCYLLDFACYKGPEELVTSLDTFIYKSRQAGCFSEESMDFQARISQRNGVSDHCYLPPALHMHPDERAARVRGARPESRTMMEAREEAGMVLFQVVGEALARTGLKPKDIDILVVNCSLFNPTPSLSAMVVNHFKFRADTVTYNLAGMGCSAGVIAVGLAQKLLRVHGKGAYALVVSTENITQNWYLGDDRSMLIPNTLFRMGGAAVVLTNKASERPRAKYELAHCVRVHLGGDDVAYECVFQHEDASGIVGVELNRDLVKVAGRALERNLTKMAPLVLPVSEMAKYAAVAAARALLPRSRAPPPYTPDFKKAFDHFCLHAGGRGVIDGLAKQLSLPAHKAAPSYNSLFWYGNTSSASLWYALGYVEAVQGVKAGEVVWQVGFGSGFKCNSAVWRALRPIKDATHTAWTHMADPSNASAVERYQGAEGGVSQGPGAPECAGPYLLWQDTGAATRRQGAVPGPTKAGGKAPGTPVLATTGAGGGAASPGRRATRSRNGRA